MTALDRLALAPALDAVARVGTAVKTLRRVLQVRRERQALSLLDPRLLRDIGVGQADAQAEAARGLFDVPTRR